MNKQSRTTHRTTRHAIRQPWALSLVLLSGFLLSACDSVPNAPTVAGGGTGSTAAAYAGQSCNAVATGTSTVEDVCNFQTEFWAKMLDASDCENCHNTDTANRQPYFMDTADVNTAYSQMTNPVLNNLSNLVDRTAPGNSGIISKINTGHNCGSPTACTALAANVTTYLTNWVNGGVAGAGTGTQSNVVTLTPPTIKGTGTSKNFPDPTASAPAGFDGVHNLLTLYCSNCHQDSAPVPQTPFFADSDRDTSYNAIVSAQKISLDIPRDSRLVVRQDEGHNCWDLTSTLPQAITEGRKNCAVLMEQAIIAFSGTIGLTAVDSSWVTSKALTLMDGTVASGGARDDSSTIALYEFKAGSGATIQDSSGVGIPLNLTLYGTEGTDYRWVGGWGVEFLTDSAKAQASTQNSRKLLNSILGSGAYSIEAWVVPANISQGDNNPARIINYSGGSAERNFTLGQAEYRIAFMNRSSAEPSPNGNTLLTDDMDEDLQSTQQHVVVTFDLATGRKVYVNGVDVATIGNDMGATDPLNPAGSLTGWDPTYAFSMGNEADFSEPWEGKLRLVAIHNRAMTPAQVLQNFDAGVGQKFFLMFSVSDQMNDPNCFLASAVTPTNPMGDQCFVYFVASQFDTYSYLFTKPTFASLNPAFTPSGTVIKGIRVGLNGKEPAVGQAYININTTISVANGYDSTTGQQALSDIGTIYSLEKGAGNDEFFLTFEDLGGNENVRVAAVCGGTLTCTSTPKDGNPAPAAGLRTFEEILASMSVMTGVDPYLSQFSSVLETYYKEDAQGVVTGIKQQLPSSENVGGFLAAHEMAVAQLAISYCDALVNDTALRDNFFGAGFAFGSNVNTAFPGPVEKNQIVDALYDKMVGIGGTALANMPSRTEIRTELVGPDDLGAPAGHPGNLFDRLFSACTTNPACTNDAARTPSVVKALCTSVLGSAAMIVQ